MPVTRMLPRVASRRLALGLAGAACLAVSLAHAQQRPAALPVPKTVSPELQALIAAPPPPMWNDHPKDAQAWKTCAGNFDAGVEKLLPPLREKLGVTLTAGRMAGVPVFTLTPKELPAAHGVHLHGGGYVLGAGESGTPWTDLTKTGDSYFTNEGVDNILVSYDGWLGDAARLYAAGHDLKDPMLPPVYGDVRGFPPTLLTTGTRDLFLSNTARMHLKLREAGVPADLIVFEGLSHAQYHMDANAPETRAHFQELARFFDRHLK